MRRAGRSIGAKLILLSTSVSVATLALATVTLIGLQYLGSNGDPTRPTSQVAKVEGSANRG